MPRISEFFGISIYMYYNDHPPPHFHAIYGQFEATVRIDSIDILEGSLPHRAERLVFEWANLYKNELQIDWKLAEAKETMRRIPPLT